MGKKYTIILRKNNKIYRLIRILGKHGKVVVKIEVTVEDGRVISGIKKFYNVEIIKESKV